MTLLVISMWRLFIGSMASVLGAWAGAVMLTRLIVTWSVLLSTRWNDGEFSIRTPSNRMLRLLLTKDQAGTVVLLLLAGLAVGGEVGNRAPDRPDTLPPDRALAIDQAFADDSDIVGVVDIDQADPLALREQGGVRAGQHLGALLDLQPDVGLQPDRAIRYSPRGTRTVPPPAFAQLSMAAERPRCRTRSECRRLRDRAHRRRGLESCWRTAPGRSPLRPERRRSP
jgi:hypothetical protein